MKTKEFFKKVYKVVTNKWFVFGLFVLSFGLFCATSGYRTIPEIIQWNVSSTGYHRPVLFLLWTISLSLFYFFTMLSLREKYKLGITPIILSGIAIAAFLVTGILVPPKGNGEEYYMMCLFIHCGFAGLFAALNFVALCLILLFRYKKTKQKKYRNWLIATLVVLVPCIVILCLWPMAGYTELLPIIYTIFVCLYFNFEVADN